MANLLSPGFWKEARSQVIGVIVGLFVPVALSALTAVSAYLEHSDTASILATTTFVFFWAMGGLLLFRIWSWIDTPRDKLQLGGYAVGKRYENGKLVGLKYGINIRNAAIFPIEYSVDNLKSSLGGAINPRPDRTTVGAVIGVGAVVIFWEAEIPITPSQVRGKPLDGDFEFLIHYGKPGILKYRIPGKQRFFAQFNKEGDLEVGEFNG